MPIGDCASRNLPALAFRPGIAVPRCPPANGHAPYDGADDRQGGDNIKQLQCAVTAVGGDAKDPFDEIHAAFSFLLSDHVTEAIQTPRLRVAQKSFRSCLWNSKSTAMAFGRPSENECQVAPRSVLS